MADDLLKTDPLAAKRRAEEAMLAEHGPEWMAENRERLDQEWRYLASLEGFDPETGAPL